MTHMPTSSVQPANDRAQRRGASPDLNACAVGCSRLLDRQARRDSRRRRQAMLDRLLTVVLRHLDLIRFAPRFDKSKREVVAQIEIVLVGNREVSIRGLQIVR